MRGEDTTTSEVYNRATIVGFKRANASIGALLVQSWRDSILRYYHRPGPLRGINMTTTRTITSSNGPTTTRTLARAEWGTELADQAIALYDEEAVADPASPWSSAA